MKKIIKDNYISTVKRGLITSKTTKKQFIDKIEEEFIELWHAFTSETNKEFNYELADVILVCLNLAKHYDIDIMKYLKKKIKINEKRAENGK